MSDVKRFRWRWLILLSSLPIRPEEQQGVIVLGEAGGFARREVPLQLPLPSDIGVSVELSSRSAVGRGFLSNELPEALARDDSVLDLCTATVFRLTGLPQTFNGNRAQHCVSSCCGGEPFTVLTAADGR
ncbi:hypothetical protein FH608_041430 [Nonomuraea phyllanthi]|uniref:Uncharacterized protein n=1 Tax=Nonomuraea phyllanthi TaxID=2219224 RepID=A0A5C4VH45_9ACTN|nr:hypothetical protein [Nonomuraea phyllanthi]KAB8188949.1 hypothetical protein FH608_041430 [Nonomuraea phyllanthi]